MHSLNHGLAGSQAFSWADAAKAKAGFHFLG